ncbi:MAG: SRPBCC family protein [Acidimicrobiia bacterium]
MAHYRTTVASTLTPDAALAYLADFTSAATWDPSVVEARRLDEGPVAVGSRFLIVSRANGRDVPLEYEIVALEPARRVVLRAESQRLTGVDTITVEPAAGGSTVTYDADLALKGVARLLDPLLTLVFRRMADRAAAGLRVALRP